MQVFIISELNRPRVFLRSGRSLKLLCGKRIDKPFLYPQEITTAKQVYIYLYFDTLSHS